MKVTISRKQWSRGQLSYLWNSDNCGCVIGHILLAEGHTRQELRGRHSPIEISLKKDSPFVGDRMEETDLAREAFEINDKLVCYDSVREQKLKTLLKNHYQLEFVA
jgi:hypothetical protein